MTRGQIVQQIANKIIDGTNKPPVIVSRNQSKDPASNPGICRICGKYIYCLTDPHAHEHGYANRYVMLSDYGVMPV